MTENQRKAAILVGAKRIGLPIGAKLLRSGFDLTVPYRNSTWTMQEIGDIRPQGIDCGMYFPRADISEESQVIQLISNTVKEHGRLDAVINLAADYPRDPFDTLDSETWDRAMANAKGSYLLGIHAARAMIANNPGPVRGHIINFGDWAAEQTPYTDYLPYLTSKAAIHFMTRCLAAEVAPLGIRVNCIAPGPTMRPPDILQEDWDAAIQAKAPLMQESSVDDIANMIATLLDSTSITGEIIRIDSGRHIRGV